jgi:hypothetical protein
VPVPPAYFLSKVALGFGVGGVGFTTAFGLIGVGFGLVVGLVDVEVVVGVASGSSLSGVSVEVAGVFAPDGGVECCFLAKFQVLDRLVPMVVHRHFQNHYCQYLLLFLHLIKAFQ